MMACRMLCQSLNFSASANTCQISIQTQHSNCVYFTAYNSPVTERGQDWGGDGSRGKCKRRGRKRGRRRGRGRGRGKGWAGRGFSGPGKLLRHAAPCHHYCSPFPYKYRTVNTLGLPTTATRGRCSGSGRRRRRRRRSRRGGDKERAELHCTAERRVNACARMCDICVRVRAWCRGECVR